MNILGKQIEVNCKVSSGLVEALLDHLKAEPFERVANLVPPLVRSLKEAEAEALRDYHGELRREAVERHIENEAKIARAKARAKVPDIESPDETARIEAAQLEAGDKVAE